MNQSKDVEWYLGLPYRIELIADPEGWFVQIPELRGCMSQGETPEEALAMIRDAQHLWLQTALEDGRPIPEPRDDDSYSGKFNVRVPAYVHRDLVRHAQEQGVSLNLYVATVLTRATAYTKGQKAATMDSSAAGAEPHGILEEIAALHSHFAAMNEGSQPTEDTASRAKLLLRARKLEQRLTSDAEKRGIKREWIDAAIADLTRQRRMLIDAPDQQLGVR